MSFPKWLRKDEARIISRIIKGALKRGLEISVFDGEEMSLQRSAVATDIKREVAATDVTVLHLYSKVEGQMGFFTLIHGNGCDVIHDYSETEVCTSIFAEIEPFTDWDRYQDDEPVGEEVVA